MTRRLKRIAPLQLGKMLAVIYGASTLLFVPFFMLFAGIASMAPHPQNGAAPFPMMIGMGVGAFVFLPFLYAFFGFITGVIGAFIYNLVAGWIGGIEVEVE